MDLNENRRYIQRHFHVNYNTLAELDSYVVTVHQLDFSFVD